MRTVSPQALVSCGDNSGPTGWRQFLAWSLSRQEGGPEANRIGSSVSPGRHACWVLAWDSVPPTAQLVDTRPVANSLGAEGPFLGRTRLWNVASPGGVRDHCLTEPNAREGLARFGMFCPSDPQCWFPCCAGTRRLPSRKPPRGDGRKHQPQAGLRLHQPGCFPGSGALSAVLKSVFCSATWRCLIFNWGH